MAAALGNVKNVALLLNAAGMDVNPRDSEHGRTPLSIAAKLGHAKIVKLLLATKGVDINSKDNFGRTALDLARRHRVNWDVVELLETHLGMQPRSRTRATIPRGKAVVPPYPYIGDDDVETLVRNLEEYYASTSAV
jgi:hypothetical protein